MRIGSASGIAGHGDFSLICPVPDGETLPSRKANPKPLLPPKLGQEHSIMNYCYKNDYKYFFFEIIVLKHNNHD